MVLEESGGREGEGEGCLSFILKWVLADQLITADIFLHDCEQYIDDCLSKKHNNKGIVSISKDKLD